jgi:hypothetical protein
MIVSIWLLFEKAGQKGFWSIIPLANIYTLIIIGGVNPWVMIFYLVPYVRIIATIYIFYKFMKSYGFGIPGFILYLVLGPLMLLYMALNKDVTYEGEIT